MGFREMEFCVFFSVCSVSSVAFLSRLSSELRAGVSSDKRHKRHKNGSSGWGGWWVLSHRGHRGHREIGVSGNGILWIFCLCVLCVLGGFSIAAEFGVARGCF